MTDKDRPLRATAGELAKLFASYPESLPVQFEPITSAWLGTSGAMRVGGGVPNTYNQAGQDVMPYDPGAYLSVYLFEDDEAT